MKIKLALIFLLFALPAYAGNFSVIATPMSVATSGGAAALTEQLYAQQTTNTEQYSPGSSNTYSQKIKCTAGATVTKVELLTSWSASNTSYKIGIFSAATGGTQYGSDSNTISVTSVSHYPTPVWDTLTFATNPEPTGDFYIRIISSDPVLNWRVAYNVAGGTS